MKIYFKGKFNGDPKSLPTDRQVQGAVKFNEIEDIKQLSKILTPISIIMLVVMVVIFLLRAREYAFNSIWNIFGLMLPALAIIPHEFLHALCFKEEAYIYSNISQGMMFVVGKEDMSKARFIFMSLLPNLVFGVIPFMIFLINPKLTILGLFGAISIPMGVGDYYNVFNAFTQMPKGALTYLNGINSFWYMPKDKE